MLELKIVSVAGRREVGGRGRPGEPAFPIFVGQMPGADAEGRILTLRPPERKQATAL